MPRPEQVEITFSVDGREVRAPQNAMLADAAKLGDVEIPVFCYEPKLGAPVGACRMCLVEIEGIPKLQTACSTPVKDGMIVHTQTDRVREAQQGVVEFLLINHPLDCPVCDKGGECPLQDITFGWGAGRSRFIEPKRHFRKPLELSPLVAIDRERCILCYRCVRFSQEVAEDYQLVLLERGAHSFVGTFDGHPYVAPFSGNIIELCPVGALTSRPYRFRARPWDIEGAGSICTLCPAQCNVELTVRDERVMRVLDRMHTGVDDGWLCDKGRFAYPAVHVDERITEPLIRDGGELRPVSWERALEEAARALGRAGERTAALAGGGASNEEGLALTRLMRDALGSPHLSSSPHPGPGRDAWRALSRPALQASVPDLEFAHAVLVLGTELIDEAPVLDLRLRKGVRRHGMRLVVAGARPSALDGIAATTVRYPPGGGAQFAAQLAAALAGEDAPDDVRAAARTLSEAGREVVVIAAERLGSAPLALADALGLGDTAGGGLLLIPAVANGRGLREVGVMPDAGPGLAEPPRSGLDAPGIAAALRGGDLAALLLFECDPLRSHPDARGWAEALARAGSVIAHSAFLTQGIRDHATIVFPAESYAEKDGTLTHPDGRVQRLRAAIGRPAQVRPGWQVMSELAARLGAGDAPATASACSELVFGSVPFYAGLSLDGLGGRGVRWPEREQASALPAPAAAPGADGERSVSAGDGVLRLGTYRSIWASPEVEHAPPLQFLIPRQRVELAPADAQRLGIAHFDEVLVTAGDRQIRARAHLRAAVPAGSVFLEDGIASDPAGLLGDATTVQVHRAAAANGARQGAAAEVAR